VLSDDQKQRLTAEHEVMQDLARRSSILQFETESDPPERYEITFRGRGISRAATYRTDVEYLDVHRCEILLKYGYPERPPQVRWLTPIFHPNISFSGRIDLKKCGLVWEEDMTLDVVCERLWDLCRGAWIDLPTADNYSAKSWYEQQRDVTLPVDARTLFDQGGPSPSNVFRYQHGDAPTTANDDVLYIGEDTPVPPPPVRPTRRRQQNGDDVFYIGDD